MYVSTSIGISISLRCSNSQTFATIELKKMKKKLARPREKLIIFFNPKKLKKKNKNVNSKKIKGHVLDWNPIGFSSPMGSKITYSNNDVP